MEWLKCQARAIRWKEEILLVEEEMRRSLEFGRWLGSRWASIHGRAKMVLERLLKDKDGDGGILIPTLTVEIDMEDSNDLELYDKLSDTE